MKCLCLSLPISSVLANDVTAAVAAAEEMGQVTNRDCVAKKTTTNHCYHKDLLAAKQNDDFGWTTRRQQPMQKNASQAQWAWVWQCPDAAVSQRSDNNNDSNNNNNSNNDDNDRATARP